MAMEDSKQPQPQPQPQPQKEKELSESGTPLPTSTEEATTTIVPQSQSESPTEPPSISKKLLADASIANTFPQGCKFSPDGLCILTAECQKLMLYNTITTPSNSNTPWKPALQCEGGDMVRSYTWYPHMDSSNPSSCCFLGVSRDQPVHLYDAYTGMIRATYRPYNGLDEMESPSTVEFIQNGQQMIMGGFRSDRMLQIFDLARPGRDATVTFKLGKTRRSKDGQKGLVSAMATSTPNVNLLAVGTYSPGSIYLYDLRAGSAPAAEINISGTCIVGHGKSHHSRKRKHFVDESTLMEGEDVLNFSAAKVKWYQGRARLGVTQVTFSPVDDHYLFSASRRSNAVLQWDLRRLGSSSFCPGIASFETDSDTNQRLEFAIDAETNQIWVGGQDNCIRIYNYKGSSSSNKECQILRGFDKAVNGVSLATLGKQKLLAAACGNRIFPSDDDWDKDDPLESVAPKTGGNLLLCDVSSSASSATDDEDASPFSSPS